MALTNKIIMEIRAGAGGDEAAIFAGDLARMYQRYAGKRNWKFSVLDANETSSNGYKSLVAEISGTGVYDALGHESGVHRVQRIPATESGPSRRTPPPIGPTVVRAHTRARFFPSRFSRQ